MDEKLADFVKQSKAQGLTQEQIVAKLKEAGWQEGQIEEVFSQPQRSVQPVKADSSSRFSPKTLILGVFIGILLIGGGVSAALYSETWNPSWNPFGRELQIDNTEASQEELPTIDSVAHVKTFKNPSNLAENARASERGLSYAFVSFTKYEPISGDIQSPARLIVPDFPDLNFVMEPNGNNSIFAIHLVIKNEGSVNRQPDLQSAYRLVSAEEPISNQPDPISSDIIYATDISILAPQKFVEADLLFAIPYKLDDVGVEFMNGYTASSFRFYRFDKDGKEESQSAGFGLQHRLETFNRLANDSSLLDISTAEEADAFLLQLETDTKVITSDSIAKSFGGDCDAYATYMVESSGHEGNQELTDAFSAQCVLSQEFGQEYERRLLETLEAMRGEPYVDEESFAQRIEKFYDSLDSISEESGRLMEGFVDPWELLEKIDSEQAL